MARVPEGAALIENRMSGAPGIRIGNVFMMAGVPHITAGMLDALTGMLEGGAPLISRTIGCWVAESEVADLLLSAIDPAATLLRSEEHTSELQSLMRISYAVFCLKKKNKLTIKKSTDTNTQRKNKRQH